MGNSISYSSVSAPVASHTIPPRASAPELPPEIWREIVLVTRVDSVLTLRQVSRDLRSVVDSLDQANLNQINQDTHSPVDLYQSDGGVRSVTRDPATQGVMARDENISPALQAFFAHSNDTHVRWRLAGNPSLTLTVQQTLAQDQYADVRLALARNPSLSSDAAQQTLAQDQDEWVRRNLARNPSLTSEARQQTLAQDQDEWVRMSLAGNRSLTSTVQQTLAQDQDAEVRETLAGNPSLTSEVTQERQARNLNISIRMFLRRIVSADR
ncbi:MAG: F-box protein [Gammaproteobacteria bacterium]